MIYAKKLHAPELSVAGCYIAGGAILSNVMGVEVNDYDLYLKDINKKFDVIVDLIDEHEMVLIGVSKRAYTFKAKHLVGFDGQRKIVQLITFRDFMSTDEVFESFDFTVCMALYDCDTKKHVFHESFYPDVAANRINFNVNTEFPYASLIRLRKYGNKGFNTSKTEYMKIGMATARKGLPNSWAELSDAIGGIYGKTFDLGRVIPENEDDVETDIVYKEYNFDNAIEELSTIALKINRFGEDDYSYDKIIREIISSGNDYKETFNLFETHHEKQMSVQGVKMGNSDYLYRDGSIKNVLIKHKNVNTSYGIEGLDYRHFTIKGTVPLNGINAVNVKITDIEYITTSLEGYVIAFEDEEDTETIASNNIGYNKPVYEVVKIKNNSVYDGTPILFFTTLGAAVEYYNIYSKSTDPRTNVKYYKATLQSTDDVVHSMSSEILFTNKLFIEGL